MSATALEEAELNAANLHIQLLLDHIGQHSSQAAQLSMAKAISSGGLGLGNKGTVSVVDTLGDSHHAVALLLVNPLDISHKLIHIEISLRHINEVGAGAVSSSETSGSSKPTGMTAHDLDDADHTGVIDPGVMINLHAGGGNILGSRSVAGAVVGAEQVVINGLGHAHHTALIANLLHILADLVAGVHRVVAAVIEEIANIVLLEDLQDSLVVRVIHIRIRHLVAAGAQSRRGGVEQQLQLLCVLLGHIDQAVTENTLDAVFSTIDIGDDIAVQSGTDHAVSTGVDNRSRTTGLTDDAGAFENIHGKIPPYS